MAGASTSRLLRGAAAAKSSSHHLPSSSAASGNAGAVPCRIPSLRFPSLWEPSSTTKKKGASRGAEQKAALIAVGVVTAPEKKRGLFLTAAEAGSVDLLLPLAYEVARRLVLRQFGATWLALRTRQCWSKIAEATIHQGVVRCQSFTLIGVAGSLVGSVPCFLEGCGAVLKSFVLQFRGMSQIVDPAEIMKLLIEALDMFLIGTALLTFGMGMYTMVYGSQSIQKPGQHVEKSHLGSFNLKKLKDGSRIQCITQAKSRIGHAIMLMLQAGVLEKFKSVPLVTGLDMACFAGAVLASSAGVFLLSKLAVVQQRRPCKPTFA